MSCLEPYRAYIAARFEDDPHLEATVLYRELVAAGFGRAYTTLVGELRRLELRPVCLVCAHRRGNAVTTEIDHPPGEEVQWDWLELAAADTPWGEPADVLVGALSHSGRFRGVFCEQMTFGHLAGAMHDILVALGGTPRVWRTDRMATIVTPQTGRITPDAAALAKHYGTQIAVCPARRAQRKGVVEAAIKYLTRSWWRTAAVATIGEAQRSLDRWSIDVADARDRPGGTVGQLGAAEPLRALPVAAYPAQIIVQRKVSRAALTAFEGNHYSVLSMTGDSYRMRRHRDAIASLRPALTGRPEGGESHRHTWGILALLDRVWSPPRRPGAGPRFGSRIIDVVRHQDVDAPLLTPAEVAAHCRMSTMIVLRAIRSGSLRAVRLGTRGPYRVEPAAVDAWIADCQEFGAGSRQDLGGRRVGRQAVRKSLAVLQSIL